MDFYDSVRPGLIPAGSYAALYYDGDFAAAPEATARLGPVRWITVTGDFLHCGIADFERGNPVFSVPGALRAWVQGRISMGKRARVYSDLANLPTVRSLLAGLDSYEVWLATLDGSKLSASFTPGLWGVQYDGGETAEFDTSVLYLAW
jgi:hypothetical protein